MRLANFRLIVCLAGALSCLGTGPVSAGATVGDAFVRVDAEGQKWTIGTGQTELSLEFNAGKLSMSSYQNKQFNPPKEYLEAAGATGPAMVELDPLGTTPAEAGQPWTLEGVDARQVAEGGRPAVELVLTLRRRDLRVEVHLLALPRTPIIRHWMELENTGAATLKFDPAKHHLLAMNLRGNEGSSLARHYWITGGGDGTWGGAEIGGPYHHKLAGMMSAEFVPWVGLLRASDATEGLFAALEYLGRWEILIDREATGPIQLTLRTPDVNAEMALAPGERLRMPTVTLGAFRDGFDDMGKRLYDWQYEYQWSYTTDEYYALMQWPTHWWGDSHNLQQTFAGRLGWMDMAWPDMMRDAGVEMLWDDAGWSEAPDPATWSAGGYGGVFRSTHQGPDFSRTLRYLSKSGGRWVAWFCGNNPRAVMDNKVGAWGDFQWRTDGIGMFDLKSDQAWRQTITGFLRAHPRSTLQTCNGGSTASHMFDLQSYAHNNYFSDARIPDKTNYYYSYLDPPDRWADIITSYETFFRKGKGEQGFDFRDKSRSVLTMTPVWFAVAPGTLQPGAAAPDVLVPGELDEVRQNVETYHYLLRQGVAGRWSQVFHPIIEGDAEYFYLQRMSHDRTKGIIVLKHTTSGTVVVRPVGLLPEQEYLVEFDSQQPSATRSGADLIAKGIVLENLPRSGVIFLSLPNRPGSGRDKTPPRSPGAVATRWESNIGHSGVGVYWSPGADDNWISYYEVRRGETVLGRAANGTYYFDHSADAGPQQKYAVRTVDGDGNASDWRAAAPLADETRVAAALGGHFPIAGRDGWKAEASTDGRQFQPMTWIATPNTPGADFGGTAQQPGGVEGYWEAAKTARVGRGWQQASTAAQCVRTWIAPKAGSIRVVGRAMKEYYHRDKGDPLHVRILCNDLAVWPNDGWAEAKPGDLIGATHDVKVNVAKGDAIRFVLNRSTDSENGLLAWMPQITMLDAPANDGKASVVRILCGANRPYVDQTGNEWSADRFFQGGEPMSNQVAIAGAQPTLSDEALYRAGRRGKDFTYSIPVTPGLYSVRLKFAEPEHAWSFQRPFHLEINGRRVLNNFDVCWIARGPRRAYERVFRYLVPDAEGRLVLRFTAGFEPLPDCAPEAMVQAIEVLPEDKPTVRLDVGSDKPFVDWNSFVWDADTNCDGGTTIRSDAPVAHASPTLFDQAIYQTARTGKTLRYVFTVPPGLHEVHLKFAELWLNEIGKRPMHIDLNGRRYWEAWDPGTATGCIGMAMDLRAENIVPDKDGKITLVIAAAGDNDAILQGLEIN